jgi:hypothetical protein
VRSGHRTALERGTLSAVEKERKNRSSRRQRSDDRYRKPCHENAIDSKGSNACDIGNPRRNELATRQRTPDMFAFSRDIKERLAAEDRRYDGERLKRAIAQAE